METLFLLVVGHALCDFALQSDTMATGKSRRRNRGKDEGDFFPPWYVWLSAHSLIHGGAVALITGLWAVGLIESVLHAAIDHIKCEGRITFLQDQGLHIVCKVAYLLYLA